MTMESPLSPSTMLALGSLQPTEAEGNTAPMAQSFSAPLEVVLDAVPEQAQEVMAIHMEGLQSSLLDTLYALFAEAHINLDERLVLGVTSSGCTVVGEHPQHDAITELLASRPDISHGFSIMAALALGEEGIGKLRQAQALLQGIEAGDIPIFQACLKGSLSHFHLIGKI